MTTVKISQLPAAGSSLLPTTQVEVNDAGTSRSGSIPFLIAKALQMVGMLNGTFVASVSSNALTIAIKTLAGTDPSATDPVVLLFRNATAGSGDYTAIDITAATSLVISSGSTMGAVNGQAFRIWIVGFNDAGTFRLGAVNCLQATTLQLFRLRDDEMRTTTAEGGAGAADNAGTIYTGTAIATVKPMRILGYMEWSSGLTTAGTWDAVPTKIQLFGPGVSKPGELIQYIDGSDGGAVNSGSTTLPFDDTIPQNTEGISINTPPTITPTSAANIIEIEYEAHLASSANQNALVVSIFKDSGANAIACAAHHGVGVTAAICCIKGLHRRLAGSTSAQTYSARGGGDQAGTTTVNGTGGARKYGGTLMSYLHQREIMA